MTDQENEPTTLAEKLWPDIDPEDYQEDSTPSEATDASVSASMETLGDGIRDAERGDVIIHNDIPTANIPLSLMQLKKDMERDYPRELAWQAWRAAWNQRGSTDSMDSLEERTARTAFEQWWEKDA